MDSIRIEEEIRYCTSCGAANKKNAIECEECSNKVVEKHSPFATFLMKRIKSEVLDGGKEKLFGIIKNFLLQHLYGVVLTITMVATGTTLITNSTPYIKKVDVFPTNEVSQPLAQPDEAPQELTEDQEWYVDMAYYVLSDYTLRRDEAVYAFEDLSIPSDTLPISELYAENNVEGYSFKGKHELLTKSIPIGIYDEQGAQYLKEGFEQDSFKFGEKVQSDIGKKLHQEGFDVMECIYYIALSKEKTPSDETPPNPVERERFRMTFVSHGDNVYIAEDVFMDRIKGDTYDLYMKYGPNGYTE